MYDADGFIPAHFLMLRKDPTAAHQLLQSATASTAQLSTADVRAVSTPGSPNRWELPDDPSALQELSLLYDHMRQLANMQVRHP